MHTSLKDMRMASKRNTRRCISIVMLLAAVIISGSVEAGQISAVLRSDSIYDLGDVPQLALRLTNDSRSDLTVTRSPLGTVSILTFTVDNVAVPPIPSRWVFSEDPGVTQILQEVVIKPGESVEIPVLLDLVDTKTPGILTVLPKGSLGLRHSRTYPVGAAGEYIVRVEYDYSPSGGRQRIRTKSDSLQFLVRAP